MSTYNIPLSVFSTVVDLFFQLVNFLDAFKIGGLFSLLDLSIAVIVLGVILPAVLNLRNMSEKGEKQ